MSERDQTVEAARTDRSAARAQRRAASIKALRRLGVPGAGALALTPTIVVAAMLSNLLGLAVPLAALQVYDRIIPHGAVETLTLLGLGLVGVAICEFVLRAGQTHLLSLSAARYGHALQVEAFDRLLRSEAESARSATVARRIDRFNAVDRIAEYFGGRPRLAMIDLPFSAVFLIVIAMIGGPIALAPIFVFSLFLFMTSRIAARTRVLARARDAQDVKAFDFVAESFNGAHTVRSFAIEGLMLRRFERLLKTSAAQRRDVVLNAGDLQRLSSVFGNLSIAATLSCGALLVIDGALTVGGLAACSLLAGRAIQPILQAAAAAVETQRAGLAVEDVAPLFAAAPAPREAQPLARAGPPEIAFEAAAVRQGDQTYCAPSSFEIEAGALALAIDEEDGSAARAFMRMTAGLEAPSAPPEERVRVGGVSPLAYRAASSSRVVYMSSDDAAFSGTILQNLTLFGRGASVEDARGAAQSLGLERLINRLPDGYDTKLAAGASEVIANGLIQRVILARALAQRPDLLLLDRPFAYVDGEGAAQLMEALQSLRDRATVILHCDRRWVAAHCDVALGLGRDGVKVLSPLSLRPAGRAGAEAPAIDARDETAASDIRKGASIAGGAS